MEWSKKAEQAIKKVPFFVRKKVRKKVEAFVEQKGNKNVEVSDVDELKKKFLSKGGMEKDIKGYDVSSCFGGAGCPNTANSSTLLAKEIESLIIKEDLLSFLKENVKTDLKFHHEFKVTLSDCPNACSRPQIVDIGIIGSVLPGLSDEPCTLCNACTDACSENAIKLENITGDEQENILPVIDYDSCLLCARCIRACPVKTIIPKEKGFRVMLGGRLGRHPRLGIELEGLRSHDQVIEIVKKCLKFYKANSKNGQRFAHIITADDIRTMF